METLTAEQEKALQQEISPVVKQATELVIKSPQESLDAQEFLKSIMTRKKKIQAFFKGMKDTAHKAWRTICDTESSYLDPLEAAEKQIKEKVVTFTRIEEDKQREIARKAEAQRLEAERKERERIEEQARKARENGKVEKAEALQEKAQAVYIAPVFTPPPPPTKAAGATFKTVWKAEVMDKKEVMKSVLDGKISPDAIEIDQSVVNKLAGVCKNSMTIPGLRFYEEKQMSVRA